MTNDNFIRLLMVDALINHIYEQLSVVANDESDGRYNSFLTQTYGLKQDLEDKLREDKIDGPVQIGTAPNLPNSNPTSANVNPTQTSNSQSNVQPNVQPNGNSTSNVPNQGVSTPNGNNANATSQPNQGLNDAATDFFNDLLAGKVGNNQDLNDLLNAAANQQTSNNSIPF